LSQRHQLDSTEVAETCRFSTSVYAYLFYFAAFVLVAGLANKVVQYARTPAPLKIPTTPAPTTRTGVAFRITREVVFFESLFRGNKWIWIFGWMFHFGLFLVTLRHLRYFIEPVGADPVHSALRHLRRHRHGGRPRRLWARASWSIGCATSPRCRIT
jgi:hypothetical protein